MSKRLDEIRRYCDTYSGSSDVEKIEYVLAELDRLTLDRDEARAQQAHTASCNIELMRKLDARDADVIQIDAALQDAYGAIEKLQVMVMKQDEALRLLLSEAGRTVDLSVDWSPDTAVRLVLHWGTIQKARKALDDAAEEDDRLFRECDIEKFGEEK